MDRIMNGEELGKLNEREILVLVYNRLDNVCKRTDDLELADRRQDDRIGKLRENDVRIYAIGGTLWGVVVLAIALLGIIVAIGFK